MIILRCSIGSRGCRVNSHCSLRIGSFLDFILLVELLRTAVVLKCVVNYHIEFLLVYCFYQLSKLLIKFSFSHQVVIQSYFSPLGPHYICIVEIKSHDTSLHVLLFSLSQVQPQTLLKKGFYQEMIISKSHLVFKEHCLLTYYFHY